MFEVVFSSLTSQDLFENFVEEKIYVLFYDLHKALSYFLPGHSCFADTDINAVDVSLTESLAVEGVWVYVQTWRQLYLYLMSDWIWK